MTDQLILRHIKSQLEQNRDPRIRELLHRDLVPVDQLLELLAQHIQSPEFDFRYVGSGRSGSMVLLLLQSGQRARVVKCGPKVEIRREERVENLVKALSSRFRPVEYKYSREIGDYGSWSSTFATDARQAQTLGYTLISPDFSTEQISELLSSAAKPLFEWHNPTKTPDLPFTFPWEQQDLDEIRETLRQHGLATLISVTESDWVPEGSQTIQRFVGICHGDLNTENFLVAIQEDDTLVPCIIDFAWSTKATYSPALDWARLERDIKLRWLRQSVEVECYGSLLTELDNLLNEEFLLLSGDTNFPSVKCTGAIQQIRHEYTRQFAVRDQRLARLEYVYCLLCWTLSYIDTEEFQECHGVEKRCILGSASSVYETFGRLLSRRIESSPTHSRDTSDSNLPSAINEVTNELSQVSSFVMDARIAGHLQSTEGQHSIYLDAVYVHRQRTEDIVLSATSAYVSKDEMLGYWLSIVGDAGHGKTSLLWYLTRGLSSEGRVVFSIQAQQLSSRWAEQLEQIADRIKGKPVFVIVDTLDLLVGGDDGTLARIINAMRAKGAFLITSSRRQELQTLTSRVRFDQVVELNRYEPQEAEDAIRKYVAAAHPDWPRYQRQLQVKYVTEILDQQRRVQDLSFEPLILRMLFEVYHPEKIPPEINTQMVYDRFWSEKVFADRPYSAAGRHERSSACKILADYVFFVGSQRTDLLQTSIAIQLLHSCGISDPASILDSLVSSGVLRLQQIGEKVGFFHQTFLEYAAARALLEPPKKNLETKLAQLLGDLRSSNLFRLPVLKQLLIQLSSTDHIFFEHIVRQVCAIGNVASARLALEVLGKAQHIDSLFATLSDWNKADPALFASVTVDVVKNYPRARLATAFEILMPQLQSRFAGEILAACETQLAVVAPSETLSFLDQAATNFHFFANEFHSGFVRSIVALFSSGQRKALVPLQRVFRQLTPGLQAKALMDVSSLTLEQNADDVAELSESIYAAVSNAPNECQAAFIHMFSVLHEVHPKAAVLLANRFRQKHENARDERPALMLARILGIAGPNEAAVVSAIQDLFSADHLRRRIATSLLQEVVRRKPRVLMQIMSCPEAAAASREAILAIFRIAAESDDPVQLRAILARWPVPERGAGASYRPILASLSRLDPRGTSEWLLTQLQATDDSVPRKRQVLVGFQSILEMAPQNLSSQEARFLFERAYLDKASTNELKRVFASTAGRIADIDLALAKDIFAAIFRAGQRECLKAAINSLRHVESDAFVLEVWKLVISRTLEFRDYLLLGQFMEVVRQRPTIVRETILLELDKGNLRSFIGKMSESIAISHLLAFIKTVAGTNPRLALKIASLCPHLDKGNAAAFSAVLENASHALTSEQDRANLLTEILKLSALHQPRIRNSLKLLKRLDIQLPNRTVVNAIFQHIESSRPWDERALNSLVKVVVKLPSWTAEDSKRLLALDLPKRAESSILRAVSMRNAL